MKKRNKLIIGIFLILLVCIAVNLGHLSADDKTKHSIFVVGLFFSWIFWARRTGHIFTSILLGALTVGVVLFPSVYLEKTGAKDTYKYFFHDKIYFPVSFIIHPTRGKDLVERCSNENRYQRYEPWIPVDFSMCDSVVNKIKEIGASDPLGVCIYNNALQDFRKPSLNPLNLLGIKDKDKYWSTCKSLTAELHQKKGQNISHDCKYYLEFKSDYRKNLQPFDKEGYADFLESCEDNNYPIGWITASDIQ